MSATAGQLIDMGTFKIPASVEIRDEGRTKKIKDTRGLFVLHAALLYCCFVDMQSLPITLPCPMFLIRLIQISR